MPEAAQNITEGKPRRSRAKPPLLNQRCRLGRRRVQLKRTFEAALGGDLTASQAELVEAAAQAAAIAEHARVGYAEGTVTLEDLVRIERIALAHTKRLGIKPQEKRAPSLEEYLAAKRANAEGAS